MSNQFSLYNRPAARRLIITLVAIELILIVTGYGLLWLYALHQQQQLGKSYLIELVDKLNHKITHGEHDWSQVNLDQHEVIENYQLIIVEPTGATTVVKNNHNDFSVPLPNWTLSNKQSNKMFYDIHGFDFLNNLA